jgi:hypothetical protein
MSAAGANALLRRATALVGLDRLGDRVLHLEVIDGVEQNYQSDRPYPPFFSLVFPREVWSDPASGAERYASGFAGVFSSAGTQRLTTLTNARATYVLRDSLTPAPAQYGSALTTRPLDVWAMLRDWLAASDVRVSGQCVYRDYPRLVLSRRGPMGEERLYLDPKTGFPVKLERVEPHFLWGQVRAEYVYSTWYRVAGLTVPAVSFRLVDGTREIERTFESLETVARDSAPPIAIPPTASAMAVSQPLFLQAIQPDTVRVGARAFLLRNPGYTELAVLARDTVFMVEATQSEERAARDSAWIGRLFPGPHPIVVIVTDLAWPHIAGVRSWVARGAPIVSHAASRPFLSQVVARRWTTAPDLLERRRAATGRANAVGLRFIGVSDSLVFAGGAVRIYPIDGIASEGALMVYLPGDSLLWASDYIQTSSRPTEYATEVWNAVRRYGLTPTRVAAEHLPVTDWSTIDRLARPAGDPSPPTPGR